MVNRHPRPPRRSLHRQARNLPPHLALASLQAGQRELMTLARAQRRTADAWPDERLLELFAAAWPRVKTSLWRCRDLAQFGMIDPGEAVPLGRALFAFWQRGGRAGPRLLRRHGADGGGRRWQLTLR